MSAMGQQHKIFFLTWNISRYFLTNKMFQKYCHIWNISFEIFQCNITVHITVYVSICVCMYLCMHACVCMNIHNHIYIYTSVCVYVVYVHVYLYALMYARLHVCLSVRMAFHQVPLGSVKSNQNQTLFYCSKFNTNMPSIDAKEAQLCIIIIFFYPRYLGSLRLYKNYPETLKQKCILGWLRLVKILLLKRAIKGNSVKTLER